MLARAVDVAEIELRTSFMKVMQKFKDKDILAAEIGVYEGVNAKGMLWNCPRMKLVLVDAWDNLVIYTGGDKQGAGFMNLIMCCAKINLEEFKGRCLFTMKDSEEAAKEVSDEHFDYVYIDGDHTEEAVAKDLRLWYPKVKKGGMLGGHDSNMPEVINALVGFKKEFGIDYDCDPKNNQGRSDFWIWK
jgi:hypothetical protein